MKTTNCTSALLYSQAQCIVGFEVLLPYPPQTFSVFYSHLTLYFYCIDRKVWLKLHLVSGLIIQKRGILLNKKGIVMWNAPLHFHHLCFWRLLEKYDNRESDSEISPRWTGLDHWHVFSVVIIQTRFTRLRSHLFPGLLLITKTIKNPLLEIK